MPFKSAIRPMKAISMAPTFTAIFRPVAAPDAAASMTFAASFHQIERDQSSTRLGSMVGQMILANNRPPGTAMNEAATRYSIFTPKPA